MKIAALLFAMCVGMNLFASVIGITINNSHSLDAEGRVLRGMEPKEKVFELKQYGITDVIIFKNQTKNEVDKELALLLKNGIRAHHIPFRWKDIESNKLACEQTLQALAVIQDVLSSENRKVYFHCTVGEDRTGYLAGMYRMIFGGSTASDVFKNEMCARGYEGGNPAKPENVVNIIRGELTPLFLMMAIKIRAGSLTKSSIVSPYESLCEQEEIDTHPMTSEQNWECN